MASLLLLKSMLFTNAMQNKKKKKLKKKTANKKKLSACRVCNEEKGEVSIFDNVAYPNIPEEIFNFSGVSINKSDSLSKHMCENCLSLLNGCILFRELCQRSHKLMLQVSIKKENSPDCNEQPVFNEQKYNTELYDAPSPEFSEEDLDIMWTCPMCNKQLYDETSYKAHLPKCNVDDNTKPKETIKRKFLCDICGKTAHSHANLVAHMSIHDNIFPFKCDVCPYKGRTIDLLKVHKRTHLADKPFKCSQCPKSTTTASNLAKHMRHVHSSCRPYKCTYCEKSFTYQHDMKRHIKDIHLRQGTVECNVCYKKFNTKKILQGHRWKIHKIKGERQGRLPSYLQCRLEEQSENNVDNMCGSTFNVI